MKKNDLGLVLIIIFVSAAASLFASNSIFGSSKNKSQQVVVAPTISPDFNTPDSRFFNSNTYDPTQLITIGPSSNQNPFSQ